MLSGNVTETPRPRPPARVRRSAPLGRRASSPPPSYAAAFNHNKGTVEGLLGSPLLATFHRVGWPKMKDQLSPGPSTDEDQEWINEKSREELSELLVKAEGVIRERENDLGMASAAFKSLYENNVALKTKHEALLKRLPTSPLSPLSPELPTRGSRYSISLSRPVSGIFDYESSPLATKSQARKISFSSAEIARLADQNAEFLDKLERMEVETVQADQSGRRELKRLEKEIFSLRGELEKTQAKSEELEEKQKAAFGWDAEKMLQEVLKKREEREEKIRAMRTANYQANTESNSSQVKDFAPGGAAFGAIPAFPHLPARHPSGQTIQLSQPEHTLISQLLEKIEELERTNNQILEQQTATVNQLNAIQRETENVSKIYECFADEEIIEMAPDVDSEEDCEPTTNEDTIRFHSLKRDIAAQTTPRKNQSLQTLTFATSSRTRKSVMGLFDANHDPHDSTSPSRHSPTSDSVFRQTETIRSSQSIGSTGLASPAFSTRSITSSRSQPSNISNSRRTLEAELGNDFNSNSWGHTSSHAHLRTNSLYQLSQMSVPASPSQSSSKELSLVEEGPAPPTPSSIGNPSFRFEPPTPTKGGDAGGNTGIEKKQSVIRLQRMSEAVNSRTNRWIEGRFQDTLRGSAGEAHPFAADQKDPYGGESQPLTPLSLRLTSAFDETMNITRGEVTETSDTDEDHRDPAEANLRVQQVKKRRGLGETMVQVWLWLQFAVVILIFVWSMARRGPESVLGKPARQRRVVSMGG